jgi:hypothetical protein
MGLLVGLEQQSLLEGPQQEAVALGLKVEAISP